jgi:hypothetical protein
MPKIDIFYNNGNESKSIDYECDTESLISVLTKFDQNIDYSKHRLIVNDEILYDWDISLKVVLAYGPSIKLMKEIEVLRVFFYCLADETKEEIVYVDVTENKVETVGDLRALLARRFIFEINSNFYHECQELNDESIELAKVLKNDSIQIPVDLSSFDGNYLAIPKMEIVEMHTCGTSWSSMEKPKVYQWSSDAPNWRLTKAGLCLEGKCMNSECDAYNQYVVMNMGTPIQYMVGYPNETGTNCPVCNQYVEPEISGFNKCEWRCLGIKKGEKGPEHHKSDWAKVGDEQHCFEDKDTQWLSLCIEVRHLVDWSRKYSQLTKNINDRTVGLLIEYSKEATS